MGSRVVPLRGTQQPAASVAGSVGDPARIQALAAENDALRAALAEAEDTADRYAGIVDSVADAIFTIGTDLVVTSWNRGAETLYGYAAEEIIGRAASLLYPPGSDEPRRLLTIASSGEPVFILANQRGATNITAGARKRFAHAQLRGELYFASFGASFTFRVLSNLVTKAVGRFLLT